MEAPSQEITLGTTICEKLKAIYHPDLPWVDASDPVSVLFTKLKKQARSFYLDKNELEILMELSKYSEQDFRDSL